MEIMPPVFIQPLNNNKIGALYNSWSNSIIVNSDNKLKSGAKLFALLTHEFTHMAQNMQIIRTKGLGQKAIKEMSKNLAKESVTAFCEKYKSIKPEDLSKYKNVVQEDVYEILESYVEAKQQGKKAANKWINATCKKECAEITEKWNKIRENLVKKFGEIEPDTKVAKQSQKYYDNFNSGGSLTGLKKMTCLTETRAYLVQTLNYYNYLLKKLF